MVDSNAVFVSAFHFCHTLQNIHSKSPRLSSCMELEEDNHCNQCGTYYLQTLLMPAIVHSFCSSVNEKSCNLRVCVNPLPHQNTLLCRVAQVGRLLANAKYAFNSFAGRIIANPQQKMQFLRVFVNTWDHCFGYSCILAKLNRNFIKRVNRDKS